MGSSRSPSSRVLLKLSGEMLGEPGQSIDGDVLEYVGQEIVDLIAADIQVALVIGGGNIWRGASAFKWGMDRTSADHMGMLATVINGLALQNVLESKFSTHTRVMSAIHMQELAEPYIQRKAIKHLEKGRVVIFAGGTGNPFFTTDTAASLRAREIEASMVLKATKVAGVYDKDPMKHQDARKYDRLGYDEAIAKNLGVMDATALTMCKEAKIPLVVFKLEGRGSVLQAVKGDHSGTVVE